MLNKEITVKKEDILEHIYFITAITKAQEHPMMGGLSSKSDFIGGIFDRWINTIPEKIIFNNAILPEVFPNTSIVSDYYLYTANKTHIAPDVIGIKVNNTIIPFAKFDEEWIAVEGMPQIEIKTFKERQYLVSLRDQNYADDKFLVIVESNFRVDYLLPFFDKNIFSEKILKNLSMDNKTFIISDSNHLLQPIKKIDTNNDIVGKVRLLKITDINTFKKYSTFCDSKESIQYIKTIEERISERKLPGADLNEDFKKLCSKIEIGDAVFYEVDTKFDAFKNIKHKKSTTLCIENIDAIKVIKQNQKDLYIKLDSDAKINDVSLKKNHIYHIIFDCLDRSSNNGTEYFMQKSLTTFIPGHKDEELKKRLKDVIKQKLHN